MVMLWIIAIIVFAIIEALTPQFVSIWFAGGAALALILELLGFDLWLQIIVFIIASILLIVITYPRLKKYSRENKTPLNADSLIGETAVTEAEINNLESTGQVKVRGQIWSAKSEDGQIIKKSEQVKILKIEGVHLIVNKI